MKAPVITLANDFHHDTSVVRLSFEKDFGIICNDFFNIVFVNHNLEQGMNLRFIQELLGHESSKTTEIYTHVTKDSFKKFKTPLDDII